jgi:xylulokinase
MLGAEAKVDYSLANRTLLFDIERSDWSDEMLELAQLDRQKLPPTVPSGVVIGSVANAIANELGLPAGIPIVSGGHDQCCNGIGCGVLALGQAMYGMGTYLCLMPVFGKRPEASAMIERGLNTEHHAVPGQYVSFLYNQGGSLVKWFRNTFAAAERKETRASGKNLYSTLLSEMPEDLSRIMVLPHFAITGPPDFIADSFGVVAGLQLETSRGEILKGLIEAMTFYIRETFETLPGAGIKVADFRAVGGGSKSDVWIQISADILGHPFVRPKINEAGVLGAAILAGVGCGVFSSLEAGVETMVQLDRTFYPDPKKQVLYSERFTKYQRLWPLMADYLRDLAA